MIPIKSVTIGLFSLVWMGISIKQWVFDFPDLSNLIFSIGFFFVGLYVAYDQWFKEESLKVSGEINKDIQAIDKKCNNVENQFIDFKRKK